MQCEAWDRIDAIIDQWKHERPELDPDGMGVAGRILVLARQLERRLDLVLEPYGLTLWQFDVLATLRRHGASSRLSPTRLMAATMLSSGAMTNRLDRLEAAGWVRREPDPDDRRGVLITLTPAGQEVIDRAIDARFTEARENCTPLSDPEREQLAGLLRKLLLELDPRG